MTRKEQLTNPELDMIVFHELIYNGREPMKIVGIRKEEIELEGDYSGGTINNTQKDWLPIKGAFRLRLVCPEKNGGEFCSHHNLHCSWPHCEPYIS